MRPILLPLLSCLLGLASAVTHGQTLRTVALSGQHAADTPSEVSFDDFTSFRYNAPVINSAGQVAFHATLTGDGIDWSNGSGIWSEGEGALALVARTGDDVLGTPPGTTIFQFNHPWNGLSLNSAGQVAFSAETLGPDPGDSRKDGPFIGAAGAARAIARRYELAPGSSAHFHTFFYSPHVLNSNGHTVFGGIASGEAIHAANSNAIWSDRSGALAVVARGGEPAPGTPAGTFYGYGLRPTSLNSRSQTAFHGSLAGDDVDGTNNRGIWSEGSGEVALVARTGQHAPGTPSGTVYHSLNFPVINSAGQTAFRAGLTDSSQEPTETLGYGLWLETSGTVELLARTGEHAAETQPGVTYSSLTSPVLNSAGQTAFLAGLSGSSIDASNEFGIWTGSDSSSVRLVARIGDPAPGTADDTKFSSLFTRRGRHFGLNAFGQVVIMAETTDAEEQSRGKLGIWAEDREGMLRLITQVGDSLEVAPGEYRTIDSLEVAGGEFNSGNDDGRPSWFNNRGQVAFQAVFDDGSSGVFVSSLVAVPEPTAVLLSLVGLVVFFGIRTARKQ